ncbi:hypothetical protein EDB19DRAFT_1704721 [Suillus lakei]|nr:hypothetical protein EDB19DRAFT_1704721 [Suillus lakei]
MALFWKGDFVAACSLWSTTMKGFEYPELTDWDGPLSSSSYHTDSHKDVPSTSFSKSTGSSNCTPASYSSSTTSSQDANEQDSDCYIIDVASSIDDMFDENCGSTRTSIKHTSSIETFSAAHMPQLFQPSNLDTLFPFQHTHDTSAAVSASSSDRSIIFTYSTRQDEVLTQPEPYLSSSQHSTRSVPTSLYAAESNLFDMSIPPLSAHNDVIELTDDEDTFGHNSIKGAGDNDNEDEEMAVDDMLTELFPAPDSSSSASRSPSPEMGDSLFTPPPISRKPHRRVILDCVSVPPFPKGVTRAGYKVSNASTSALQQGVEHPSISHAFAAAFAQNDRPPSPSLSRKGKERERERPPPAPMRPRKKYKPRSRKFGDDVSTVPNQILDAQYPALELDIHELPTFLPHHDNILRSSTYYIYLRRIQRLYAQLQDGLPEMIAEMKGLAVPDDEKDEKEDGPILPHILAPLFEERPDIEAALAPYFGRAPPKSSSRKGKIKNSLEAQNVPSSSKPKPGFTGTVLQTQGPSSSNVVDDISHYTVPEEDQTFDFSMEMDQYLNDLGDSPAKTYPPGIKHARSTSNAFIGFLHNTTRLPPDVASVTREDAEDSFFGVPPSPKMVSESPSLQLTDGYATNSSHSLDASFDLVLPEDDQWCMSPTIEKKSISPDSTPSGSAGTIDPSLLGGSEPPLKSPPSSLPQSTGAQHPKQLPPGPIIYVRRPPGVSASQEAPALSDKTPGKSRRNVQIKYRTSESVSVTDEGDAASLARKVDADEVKDDGEWTAEAVSGPPAPSGVQPSLKIRIRRSGTRAGSDGSFVPSNASGSASPAVLETPPEMKLPKVHAPRPAQVMPQDDDRPEAVATGCHQCRNTHTRPKMQCSKRRPDKSICGKRFCNRCMLNRYPEMTFVRNSKTFICPVCINTCNCSFCARKRGEEYISMRGGGFAGSRTKSGILLVPDDSNLNQVQDGPMTPEPPQSAPQTMFWAHVYGLGGERVGRAFIDDASASAPVRPTQPAKQGAQTGRSKQKVKAKPKKKPRVFIGTPLREWKIRTIKDLEPSPVIPPLASEDNYVGKGKGKAVERPRVYIGDARWLYVPYTRMPVSSSHSSRPSSPNSELELDSDGTLTPLEDLEEGMGWPQPEVGESVTVTWGSVREQDRSASSSLSPDDLAKAIGVALAATREETGE